MFPDLIQIGNFTIHTYGVLVAIGLIVGYSIALYFAKKENLDVKRVENLIFYTLIGAFIGARIAYVIEHSDEFNSFIDYIAVWKGGIDWFGGFLGGVITAIYFIKKYNLPLWKIGDIAGVSIIIGHAFGRLGCTAAGCCYGKPVPADSIFKDFAITFPHNPHTLAPPGMPLYPTQPLEAIGNFTIFILLFFIYKKKKFDGQILALYLILYGLERFLLEFMRGVTPPIPIINLTWNQIITIGMVIAGIIIYIRGIKLKVG